MENEIKDYIIWYKTERNQFCREAYIDRSSWLKNQLSFYSNWDSEEVLTKESSFILKAFTELNKRNITKKHLSLATLTLSNRVEYISDHSDFYVTYAALMIFSLTVMGAPLPILLKTLLAFLIFGGVLYSFNKRLKFRQETAIYKELINIFKQFESKHT